MSGDLRERVELKPCPFCGGKDQQIKTGMIDGEHAVSAVYCMSCGGSGAYAEIQDHAIESWNRRALLALREDAPGLRDAFRAGFDAAPGLPWRPNLEQIASYATLRDKLASQRYPAALAARPVEGDHNGD